LINGQGRTPAFHLSCVFYAANTDFIKFLSKDRTVIGLVLSTGGDPELMYQKGIEKV